MSRIVVLATCRLAFCNTEAEKWRSWLNFREPVDDRAGIRDVKPSWNKPREVARRRDLSFEAYQDEFQGLPVVLEGAYEHMPCVKDGWVEERIIKPFQQERVVFLAHQDNVQDRMMSTKLATFLKNVNQNSQSAWAYLQDEFFLPRHRELLAACPPLPAFLAEQDLFSLMPPVLRPRNATLLWGGRYSRSKLHVDRYNWTGTNLVLRGEKFFRLIPPGRHDRHFQATTTRCDSALQCVAYESPTDLFESVPEAVPLWEAKLSSGDVLIIPSGWWHQAVNLGNTIALASGLIGPRGAAAAVAEVLRYHATAHAEWQWGKLPDVTQKEVRDVFRRFVNALPEEAFKTADRWVKARQEL